MNKLTRPNLIFIIGMFLIAALGCSLAKHNFASVPFAGESRDEYSFAWLGLSLINSGLPVATSGLPAYNHIWRYVNVDNIYQSFANPNPFPIDSPWFDHPPLFSFVPAVYAQIKGVASFSDASTAIIRRPMVFIFGLNISLVIILTAFLFGRATALLAGLIFATTPLFVISSRLVQAENFLITMFLASLIALRLFAVKRQYIYFWLALAIAGLSTLIKLSGWSVCLSIIGLLFTLSHPRKVILSAVTFLGTLAFFILFPLYGYILDWSTFVSVLAANSQRYFKDGLAGFYQLITQTNITRDFQDTTVLFGWMSAFHLASVNRPKYLYVNVPLVSYLVVYLIFGSQGYGWYKFPFYPFLAISIAIVITNAFRRGQSLVFIFLLLLVGGSQLNRFVPPEALTPHIWFWRLFCALCLAFFFLSKKQKSLKLVYLAILAFLIVINIYTVYSVDISAWYQIK